MLKAAAVSGVKGLPQLHVDDRVGGPLLYVLSVVFTGCPLELH
jgi:hypothetical protein